MPSLANVLLPQSFIILAVIGCWSQDFYFYE